MVRPIVVVGAGIVGLATAYTLLRRRPQTKVIVLEKERRVGTHQTGHNSGVIHTGVYYRPGSLKARFCRDGRELLLEYLRSHGLPFETRGKVIVATRASEFGLLEELGRRARLNGVSGARLLDEAELRALEPEVAPGPALHVPGTGIVDYTMVARSLEAEIVARGGEVRTARGVRRLVSLPDGARVLTDDETIDANFVVNAAGLYADRLAATAGSEPPCRIVPFRGEYYTLRPHARGVVHGLVYPVPDPTMPFLGVHLTPRIDGSVEAGPNAILAFAREGYRKLDVNLGELASTLLYPGFRSLLWKNWDASLKEVRRSLSKRVFVEDLRALVPRLGVEDVGPGGSGVRAQAVTPAGELAEDFLLVETKSTLHVLNAPSPAATSSLAIAEHLVERIPATSS